MSFYLGRKELQQGLHALKQSGGRIGSDVDLTFLYDKCICLSAELLIFGFVQC